MMTSRAKILIVEDEEPLRRLYATCLEQDGYQVVSIGSGKEGIVFLESDCVDLILLDLRMPGMSGLEFMKVSMPMLSGTPVIVISGAIEVEEMQEMLRLGVSDCLLKPVANLSQLTVAVERALDRSRVLTNRTFCQSELEERVAVRTAEIEASRRNLEDTIAHLRRTEAIGRLAGGVAHDVNNLLSPILTYGQILMEDMNPQEERFQFAQEIVNAACRARDLVQRLLTFGQKQVSDYRSLELVGIIRGFEKLLRRTVREDIEIEIVDFDRSSWIAADLGQIEQVLMNLCVNAQDAMSRGGRITIETSRMSCDLSELSGGKAMGVREWVVLLVTDSGCGMTDEVVNVIFDPFYTTKGEQGTGLGLATVFEIVAQHQGYIEVDSTPGKGTTFRIYFPHSDVERNDTETALREQTIPPGGTETIMLVEDNNHIRWLTRIVLQRYGYHVLEAENSRQALQLLESDGPGIDLLLSDLILPDMSGLDLYDFATRVRPGLPGIFMSGSDSNASTVEQGRTSGVQFIPGPFRVSRLLESVRIALGDKTEKHSE